MCSAAERLAPCYDGRMTTVKTHIRVAADGTLTGQAGGLPPGEHDAEITVLNAANQPDARTLVPDTLLRSIVAELGPQRIIVFGSRARGDARPDSDIDLLVVLDDDVPLEKLGAKAIHAARGGYRKPLDIIPCRASVLAKRARAIGSFAHVVLRDGVTVYERSAVA
jgi:hypothetical protein